MDNDNRNENKTETEQKNVTRVTSPRPPIKEEEPKIKDKATEKCNWGPGCPFCKSWGGKRKKTRHNSKRCHPNQNYKKTQARR